MWDENFITFQQVIEAADEQGLIQGPDGSLDIRPIVQMMTGLDMSKYELVQDFNAHGWRIQRV